MPQSHYTPVKALGDRTELARAGASWVVLKRAAANDVNGLQLREEARIGQRLFHAHIATTVDFINDTVLVQAFIDGVDCARLLEDGPLPPDAAVRVGLHLAEALDCLHHALDDEGKPLGAIHGALELSSVMVDRAGESYLVNLGHSSGTPPAAREWRTGAPAVVGDVWSLGHVVALLACGDPSPERFAALPPGLAQVLRACLDRDPGARPTTALDVARQFRALQAGLGDGRAHLALRVVHKLGDAEPGAGTPMVPALAAPLPPRAAPAALELDLVAEPIREAPVPIAPPVRARSSRRDAPEPTFGANGLPVHVDTPSRSLRPLWIGAAAVGALIVVIVALQWLRHSGPPVHPAASSDVDDIANVPDCYTGADGQYFSYEDRDGSTVVVDRLYQVPSAKRKQARCVGLVGPK